MSGPRRYESADTLVIDLRELARATKSDEAFEAWSAAEIERAITRTSVPPPPNE